MNPRLSLATGLVASLALAAPARAEGQGRAPDDDRMGADAGTLLDRREIIVPVPAGSVEVMRIDNPMGRVEIRGGARADVIHVIAQKRASSAEALGRLRVHYTAYQKKIAFLAEAVHRGGGSAPESP